MTDLARPLRGFAFASARRNCGRCRLRRPMPPTWSTWRRLGAMYNSLLIVVPIDPQPAKELSGLPQARASAEPTDRPTVSQDAQESAFPGQTVCCQRLIKIEPAGFRPPGKIVGHELVQVCK